MPWGLYEQNIYRHNIDLNEAFFIFIFYLFIYYFLQTLADNISSFEMAVDIMHYVMAHLWSIISIYCINELIITLSSTARLNQIIW